MRTAVLGALLIALSACGGDAPPAPSPQPAAAPAESSAADRAVPAPVAVAPGGDPAALDGTGGRAGLVRVVDRFYAELLADPLTAEYFELAEAAPLKAKLVDQFCELLGGPCTYGGRSMRSAHWGMRLEMRHFDATLAALERALEAEGVDPQTRRALLERLSPMYVDIVEFRGAHERPAIEARLAAPEAP